MAPAADELYARYEGAQDRFYEQPLEAQTFERMRVYEERMMHDLLDFVYDNRDAFVLVFARSAGTAWERYLDRFIELEVRSTARYVREMREHGIGVVEPTPEMSRILAGMFFRGYFEPLLLGLSREAAHAFVADFERFFHAGYALAQRDARAQRDVLAQRRARSFALPSAVILAESLHRAPVRPCTVHIGAKKL